MPQLPPAPIGERVAWALILFTLGAFMLGTWFNRRRGKALGFWIEDGLRSLGGQPAWTFIKSVSSGAVATVRNTNAPFRSLEAAYYLLTREIPPLYGVELLRGKRDLFSIKANLSNSPAAEFDVMPLGGKLAQTLDEAAGDEPYTWVELPHGLGLATRDPDAGRIAARVRPFAERYGQAVQRLSVRRRDPNVIVFMHLDGLEDRPSRELFDALKRVT
jgi:hypothetical protein